MLPTFTYVFAEELFPIAEFWFNLLEVSTRPVRRFGSASFHPLSEGLAGPLSGELAHPVRRFAPPARLIEQPSELQWLNSLETTCSPGND